MDSRQQMEQCGSPHMQSEAVIVGTGGRRSEMKNNPSMQLAKVLAYVLGRRPDEFGLVTDPEGFVKIKDLLKALSEEKEFRHIRRGHLEEISITLPDAPIEIMENRVRAKERSHLPSHTPAENIPKLLYTCVRRKAYPVVLEKGVSFDSRPFIVLSSDRSMAERIGHRSDASPIVLTVSVQQCLEKQAGFLSAGGTLYLAETIPAGCFTGPPLAKVHEMLPQREAPSTPTVPKHPGSFFPNPADIQSGVARDKQDRRGDRPEWKRDRKRMMRTERKKGPRF
jgi:putative RNA 2'-phosphotransferase